MTRIAETIDAAASVFLRLYNGGLPGIDTAADILTQAIKDRAPILVCGNGGSAAQASHLVAELVGRFKKERSSIPAINLAGDLSTVTAIANDYGFEEVYARQVSAFSNAGALICFTTSGKSPNIVAAAARARLYGIPVIVLTGESGGKFDASWNAQATVIRVASQDTARIQEAHLLLIHILCGLIEEAL